MDGAGHAEPRDCDARVGRSIARVTALFLNRTAGSSTNLFALGE
jgi:hypothetical protein